MGKRHFLGQRCGAARLREGPRKMLSGPNERKKRQLRAKREKK